MYPNLKVYRTLNNAASSINKEIKTNLIKESIEFVITEKGREIKE